MTAHVSSLRTLRLRLLQTTDIHGQVLGYDYFQDRPEPGLGLDRLARLIATARAEAPGAILCDSGDFLQGTPLCDLAALEFARDPAMPHPVIAAMNLLRYDAVVPGNHEFDYGLPLLRAAAAQAQFPVTCANLFASPDDALLFAPHVLLTRRLRDLTGQSATLRIGIFGLAPPLIAVWGRDHVAGHLRIADPVATAQRMVRVLRAAGADVIVALNHTGIAPRDEPSGENTALAVAGVPGIDAVLCGHQHRVFPGADIAPMAGVDPAAGRLAGTAAVMAGSSARHLGMIDLTLQHNVGPQDGGWRVNGAQVSVRRLPTPPEAVPRPLPAFDRLLRATHDRTLTHIRREVGTITRPLHSYFAQIGDCAALHLLATAQSDHVRPMLADTPLGRLPLLSAVAPFRAGGRGGADNYTDIAAGSLTMRNLIDLYPYPNRVAAVQVTGRMVADWLERSAGMFHQLHPDQPDQPLLRADFPSYNFDVIFGLTYRIDLSQPARYDPDGRCVDAGAVRITDLRLAGQPLDPDASVVVATNSYRAAGGGFFTALADHEIALPIRDTGLSALTAHVAAQKVIAPRPTPTWRFVPLPGTSAIYETGPRAFAYLTDAPALTPLGRGANGFARFRLAL